MACRACCSCSAPTLRQATAKMSLRAWVPGLVADGGPGDDSLSFRSLVAGTLDGGGGRDRLFGGSNDDTLIDGDTTGAADADVLDGRGSNDTVSYATRTARVRVDLGDAAPDGELGEGDVLRSIERVHGGSAGDIIAGTARFNAIDGNGGADRIRGRAGTDFIEGGAGDDELAGGDGSDTLSGDSGADVIRGGAGRDAFFVRRDGPDDVTCGPGRGDVVSAPNRHDFLRPDCEAASFSFTRGRQMRLDPHPGNSVTFRLHCPSSEELEGTVAMSGSIALRDATGQQLGRGRIPVARGATLRPRHRRATGAGPRRAQRARPPAALAPRWCSRDRLPARPQPPARALEHPAGDRWERKRTELHAKGAAAPDRGGPRDHGWRRGHDPHRRHRLGPRQRRRHRSLASLRLTAGVGLDGSWAVQFRAPSGSPACQTV